MIFLQQPEYLLALLLPALCALVFVFFKKTAKSKQLVALFSEPLKKSSRKISRRFQILFCLFLISISIFIWASARPSKKLISTKKWAESIDILIALDVSESMDATDFEPDRLFVAKRVIKEFIERRPNDRMGLIVFGGEAITTSPLTRDTDFLLTQLENAKTRELKQGTAIGMAVANGVARFQRSKNKSRVLILLTDGDNNVGAINPITAALLAQEEQIKIYSIGIGRSERVIVPIYAQDSMGNKTHLIAKVPSYLNPELLDKISTMTGGKSYMATDPESLDKILREIDSLERTKVQIAPVTRKEEVFFPYALAAFGMLFLIILLLETRFRRTNKPHAMAA